MPAELNEPNIAWAAGLYEGEGTFYCCKTYTKRNGNGQGIRKTPQPLLRIAQSDKEPLEKWQSIFGGRILGPYMRKLATRPLWFLCCDRRDDINFAVGHMWKYLSPRRRQQIEGSGFYPSRK